MIGHLGVEPLAAKAIATSLIGAVSWIFAFLIFGTTSLVASQYGSRNYPLCGEIFRHALAVAVAGGSLVAFLLFLFAPQLYAVMGAGPDVAEQGVPYFRIRCATIPMLFSIYAAVGFLRGIQNTVSPMLVAFLMSGTNIVLDYALIYGGLGFPVLGMRGAAVAAVVAHALGVAVYLRLLFFSEYTGPYQLNSGQLRLRRFRNLSRIAGHLALRTAGLRMSLVFATAMVARMGPVYLAAYEIVFQLFIFCSDTIDGLAVAGQTLVARHLGAGDGRRAQRLGWMLVGWGCAGGAVFGAAYLTLQQPLLGLLTSSTAVTDLVRTEAYPAAGGVPAPERHRVRPGRFSPGRPRHALSHVGYAGGRSAAVRPFHRRRLSPGVGPVRDLGGLQPVHDPAPHGQPVAAVQPQVGRRLCRLPRVPERLSDAVAWLAFPRPPGYGSAGCRPLGCIVAVRVFRGTGGFETRPYIRYGARVSCPT